MSYRILTSAAFAAAAALRLLLWRANPPGNAFDDHFAPILLILKTGAIPAHDACWQCYHPPVFYWTSALVARLAAAAGAGIEVMPKLLQFLPCLYGILTVWLTLKILEELPLPALSRLVAFATVCFLPRHIYMSAMNSNDSLSYLLAALGIYLLFAAVRKGLSALFFLAAGLVVTAALFTKYTAFALLPATLAFLAESRARGAGPAKRSWAPFLLAFALPAAALGAYLTGNAVRYGSPLPWNVSQEDPALTQPRDPAPLNFFTFKPWEAAAVPVMEPGKMHSALTLLYAGLWFDNEPKFLCFPDKDPDWWLAYYAWLRGERPFPGENKAMPKSVRWTGAGLITLGLFPLLFLCAGFYRFARRDVREALPGFMVFPTLLIANAAVVYTLAARLPVYSAVKASYLLLSIPALAALLALGLAAFEERRWAKPVIVAVFSCLFTLSSFHILQLAGTLRFG